VALFDLFRWRGRKSVSTLDLFRELYRGRESLSGKTVNLQTAIGVSAVFACARVIGNGMAQVPLKLMQKTGKSRLEAVGHPLTKVFRKPNPWQTGFEFRQTMSWHVELCGNFYAFINRLGGEIRELIPIEPGRVTVVRKANLELVYKVRGEVEGNEREFPAEAIWHVRGPSWNSWMGLDVLQAARDAIGLALSLEEAQAGIHKNGIQPSGIYSVEGKLNPDQYKALRDWLESEYTKNPGRPLILDRAAKWMQTQMSSLDAQTRETRRDQIEEICRFFVVMPIMLGYSDKVATYASAEQMFLAHAVHTLDPRWKMYQDSLDVWLLTERERDEGFYFKFIEEGMIAASAKDKKDTLLGYVNGGVMTPNEGRDKLDLNPDKDPKSDELREPVNVAQQQGGNAGGDASGASGKGAPAGPASTSVTFHEGAIQVKTEVHPGEVKVETFVEPANVKPEIRVENNNHIPPTQVTVQPAETKTEVIMPSEVKITGMPPRESVSETERDAKGNIARVKQTEKDA
jgi:HK97 family phage portal protein